jgi:predicted dehydrogenase
MTDRRAFLQTSAVATASLLSLAPAVHAGGSDAIKVGLVGCGGRGTGAVQQAANAASQVRITALADFFPARLESCKQTLKNNIGEKFAIPEKNCFTGLNAYKELIESDVDVVLLATPPHFRPTHFRAVIEAGKHAFVEKPMGTDMPSCRSMLETAALAKKKNLAAVAGFCWRYHNAMREMFRRIHEGDIGDIISIEANYITGLLWYFPHTPDLTDMQWQIKNWLYFTWLSGDHIIEQTIHTIDKITWAMKNTYPATAIGMGGRQVRTDPVFGNIYDHHAVAYEYDNGVKAYVFTRQMAGCDNDNSFHVYGTKGSAHWHGNTWMIKGPNSWRAPRELTKDDMYQHEHNELFDSILHGKPINDGEWSVKSTMTGIMGRMATYTGKKITWDMAINSQEDLSPPNHDYSVEKYPTPPVAMPGKTKFF